MIYSTLVQQFGIGTLKFQISPEKYDGVWSSINCLQYRSSSGSVYVVSQAYLRIFILNYQGGMRLLEYGINAFTESATKIMKSVHPCLLNVGPKSEEFTYTGTNLPDHCCKYWNITRNGRTKTLKHFLDTAMVKKKEKGKKEEKKPRAIFVDSTILVNGYHIYSTACNYNSSVSNLCFACWDASSLPCGRQFSAISLAHPPPLPLEHVGDHVGRR